MNLDITSYCQIIDNSILVNGKSIASFPAGNLLRDAYDQLEIKYAKFHKMDEMSKLGIVATEALLSGIHTEDWDGDMVGLFFQTTHGCLDTDITHQEMIGKKAVSPAVFVYTLPNIVIGEITIKHKWHGESALFVGEWPNLTNLVGYCTSLFKDRKINKAIIGYIDAFKGQYSVRFALIENINEEPSKPIDKIKELFK